MNEAPAGLTDEADLHFGTASHQTAHVKADELVFLRDLGKGTFGLVTERLYEPLNIKIAVKPIRQQYEPAQRTAMMRDLEVCKNRVRLSLYGHLLRWSLPRGRGLDLYGGDGHVFIRLLSRRAQVSTWHA